MCDRLQSDLCVEMRLCALYFSQRITKKELLGEMRHLVTDDFVFESFQMALRRMRNEKVAFKLVSVSCWLTKDSMFAKWVKLSCLFFLSDKYPTDIHSWGTSWRTCGIDNSIKMGSEIQPGGDIFWRRESTSGYLWRARGVYVCAQIWTENTNCTMVSLLFSFININITITCSTVALPAAFHRLWVTHDLFFSFLFHRSGEIADVPLCELLYRSLLDFLQTGRYVCITWLHPTLRWH